MNTHPDFEELFQLPEENRVDYMIVGGYAVAFHGYPRFTKDIDIFFDSSPENINQLRKALVQFGFEYADLPLDAFTKPDAVLTFGVAPSRVDLLNAIDGVQFHEAKMGVVRGHYGKAQVSFIGRDDLIRNKRASARPNDHRDADELEQCAPP